MVSTPLEKLRHTAARTACLAITDVIAVLLRPEEQIEFSREVYSLIRACLEAYDEEKAKLN